MAKKIIVANWKMNPKTSKEAVALFAGSLKVSSRLRNVETVICPPDVYLPSLSTKKNSIILGAQNVSEQSGIGPYTGEVSAEMLKNLGVRYVIIGHSSRRENGETDDSINRKIKSCLKAGLKIVLCVGEKERGDNGEFIKVVETQLTRALEGTKDEKDARNIIIAYEPVWAISRGGKFASDDPDAVFGMSIFIKKTSTSIFGEKAGGRVPIIYGGSATAKNTKDFLEKGGVRGLLVGGKSLDLKEFGEILKIADKVK